MTRLPMVDFVVHQFREHIGRIGCIKSWANTSLANVETPFCMVHTTVGHIPHLTHDVIETVKLLPPNVVYQLTLPSL